MSESEPSLAELEALVAALDRRAKSVAHTQRAMEEQIKLLRRELTAVQGQVQALRQRAAA